MSQLNETSKTLAATVNLNETRLDETMAVGWHPTMTFQQVPRVTVLFASLSDRLVAEIGKAEQIVGCTAWLTNDRILRALAAKSAVSVIVQNDDLGYRSGARGGGRFATTDDCRRWADRLSANYAALRGVFLEKDAEEHQRNGTVAMFLRGSFFNDAVARRSTTRCSNVERAWLQMALGQDTVADRKRIENGSLLVIDSVRAIGVRATKEQGHVARMHHKFFVFFDALGPYAVFTGSFNPTGFAEESLENAVLIESRDIASLYALEHAQLLLQSAPLSWAGSDGTSMWGCRAQSFVMAAP